MSRPRLRLRATAGAGNFFSRLRRERTQRQVLYHECQAAFARRLLLHDRAHHAVRAGLATRRRVDEGIHHAFLAAQHVRVRLRLLATH